MNRRRRRRRPPAIVCNINVEMFNLLQSTTDVNEIAHCASTSVKKQLCNLHLHLRRLSGAAAAARRRRRRRPGERCSTSFLDTTNVASHTHTNSPDPVRASRLVRRKLGHRMLKTLVALARLLAGRFSDSLSLACSLERLLPRGQLQEW